MIELPQFIELMVKTPFHYKHYQKKLCFSSAVSLLIRARFEFTKFYVTIDGFNKQQRNKSIDVINKIGLIPILEEDKNLINNIACVIRDIDFIQGHDKGVYVIYGIGFDIPIILDDFFVVIKITQDASDNFEKEILRRKHYIHASLASKALPDFTPFIIAVEITEPHAYSFFKIDQDLIDHGINEIQEKLELLNECQKKNSYPSYFGGGAKIINKPNYL